MEDLLSRIVNFNERKEDLEMAVKACENSFLLGHKEEAIYLVNVSCILHLLCIFAPNVPFSLDSLEKIFRTISKTLKGIANISIAYWAYYF